MRCTHGGQGLSQGSCAHPGCSTHLKTMANGNDRCRQRHEQLVHFRVGARVDRSGGFVGDIHAAWNERTLRENYCRQSSTRGAPFAERTWQCVAWPSPDKVTGARQLRSSCHLPQPGRLVSAHNGVNNTYTTSPQDRRQPWHIPADTLPQWHRGRHCVVHPTAAGRQR